MKAATLSHSEQEVICTEDVPIQEVRAIKKKCTCLCFYSIGTAATQKKRRIDNCVLLTSGACAMVQRILLAGTQVRLSVKELHSLPQRFGREPELDKIFYAVSHDQSCATRFISTAEIADKLALVDIGGDVDVAVRLPNHIEKAAL